jgi:hypothetical protein
MERTAYLPQLEHTYFSYFIDGITSFNGISYFIIKNTVTDSYTHYLREDTANKIVYEYYLNTDYMILTYLLVIHLIVLLKLTITYYVRMVYLQL